MLIEVMIVVAACGLAWAVLLVLNKFWPHEQRKPHNDVFGFVYAVVGVLYAVVLAFMVIVVWENTGAAQKTVSDEMVALRQIHDLTSALPVSGAATAVLTDERDYVELAVTREWKQLPQGVEPRTEQAAAELRTAILKLDPGQDPRQAAIYTHILDRQHDWLAARRERVVRASDGIQPAFWWAMIIGAVLTIGYIYLFGIAKNWPHVVMVLIPTMMIVGLLVLIWDASKPFSGMISISSEPLEAMLAGWH